MDTPKIKKDFFTPKLYLVAACVVIALLAAAAGFFFWKYTNAKNGNEGKQESSRIINSVGELYQLPTGEEPTVALVQDKDKLSNQAFFDKAQNGDYILIYKKAKLALLYRKSLDKLINVGPISLDNQQNGQAAGATTKEPN